MWARTCSLMCHIGKCAISSFIHCRRSWRQSLSQLWLTYADALQQVSTSVSTLDLFPLQLQLRTSRTYFLPSFWHRNIPRCQGSTTWHRMNFKWKTLISNRLRGNAMSELFLLKSRNPSLIVTPSLIYTHRLFHTDAFTHRPFYTQTLWHTNTQTLLHTEALTHRRFYTQMLLHTEAFTHK